MDIPTIFSPDVFDYLKRGHISPLIVRRGNTGAQNFCSKHLYRELNMRYIYIQYFSPGVYMFTVLKKVKLPHYL